MKIQEVLDKTTRFFKEKNFESARLDAELLISSALEIRRIDLYLKFDQPLAEPELEKCRGMVKRRATGEPVAYILGRKEFFGIEFLVDSRVLIPRPETELMVEFSHEWIKNLKSPTIADLGCGSGCISLSLLKKNPTATAQLVDASEEALQVARENAHLLQVQERCEFIFQRAQVAILTPVDLVVANPPYIGADDAQVEEHVRIFEPHLALFANQSGFQEIYDWTAKSLDLLKEGGRVIFEIGMTQAQQTMNRFREVGFSEVQLHRDLSGLDRFISARKQHNG